ncbi:transcription initiation factor TFIIE subunit alpha [Paragonimus westermani]|uniref:Transcription initiation factor TFIIE subunit alpha n=1 Tax=Paragonimus westermani TaxID=34504 RepID=A0A5J4NMC5_9TREM|nr:transcription initiation factor TFIIE subunit alpha [Paragonimus westermani]
MSINYPPNTSDSKETGSSVTVPKRLLSATSVSLKRPASAMTHPHHPPSDANGNSQKCVNRLPACLKKLVRSIVRTFYSREHSIIVDLLVRNTIMKEEDLCERLRFEKKQLRQYLHTLKTDQFIKSKLQLETDADGKTTKITHYFIEYQLFVNVVKYRLDQMQRRLEAEQRQSTSRASFRCASCRITYTDLEVDRLVSVDNPSRLECVYCRAEVTEEEDNVSRTDARALIAKFHHQVRDPIDVMLRECDEVHLSSYILEPEIRPLEPLNDEVDSTAVLDSHKSATALNTSFEFDAKRESTNFGPTENRVRIVLTGQPNPSSSMTKQRPIWMADSTINAGPAAGLGELDRGPGQRSNPTVVDNGHPGAVIPGVSGSVTQTLTPGRVPSGFSSTTTSGGPGPKDGFSEPSGTGVGQTPQGGDIMQLLLVHERRGLITHLASKGAGVLRLLSTLW